MHSSLTPDQPATMGRPRICGMDLPDDVVSILKNSGYALYKGSLGSQISVPNKSRGQGAYVLLDYVFPENFHEFDICIFDLTNPPAKTYKPAENIIEGAHRQEVYALYCQYPTTVFDSRPFAAALIPQNIESIQDRPFLQIIFACSQYEIQYEPVLITNDYHSTQNKETRTIYNFSSEIPLGQVRRGKEVKLRPMNPLLSSFLGKYQKDFTYEQTFRHAQRPTQRFGSEDDPNFIPLLENINGEIVSFAYWNKNRVYFVFPNVSRKAEFLSEFLNQIAVEFIPDIFPFSTRFNWINKRQYWLPGHQSLLAEKEKTQKELDRAISSLDQRIVENEIKYKFLHRLLIETGDSLVEAAKEFFIWLGFKKVEIITERNNRALEEDLQIEHDNGLIIVEVKGLGGTSTDSDCSQIAKIRTRRFKQRKAFDVTAIYLVNHQRYLPPDTRQNPPFSDHQINDARDDERGLLTTWQLFNLYHNVENAIITKEDARSALLQPGLISFSPKVSHNLGKPKHLYKDGLVAILDLDGTTLETNQDLIVETRGEYSKAQILSIQVDDKAVEKASNCEVGVMLSEKIDNASILWTA